MSETRYDPMVVQPMRDELTQIGFQEPLTPGDVEVLGAEDRTVLMMVKLATVFAGVEIDTTKRARSRFRGTQR